VLVEREGTDALGGSLHGLMALTVGEGASLGGAPF
jgi:hypothetical protein